MSQLITKRNRVSRRRFLQGLTASGSAITVGLPPLVAMFNSTGTAYAAAVSSRRRSRPASCCGSTATGSPRSTGFRRNPERDFRLTPCLAPLARFRKDIHVLSGLDNPAAGLPGPGNGHHNSMSGLMTGTMFTGRGAGGPSIDQAIAAQNRWRSASARCRSASPRNRSAKASSAT